MKIIGIIQKYWYEKSATVKLSYLFRMILKLYISNDISFNSNILELKNEPCPNGDFVRP